MEEIEIKGRDLRQSFESLVENILGVCNAGNLFSRL
jgi:hypothetical protein